MSMSQEEIESLMNGLDIAEDDASDVATGDVEVTPDSVPEVSAPVEVTPESIPEVEEPTPIEEKNEPEESGAIDNDSIDDLINNLEMDEPAALEDELENDVQPDDIDELLASIDTQEEVPSDEEVDSSDIDDLIASLDNVTEEKIVEVNTPIEEEVVPEPVVASEEMVEENAEKIAAKQAKNNSDFVEEKIQSGIFPLPADNESKVVAQLTAVAEDSEEKATKIFDVLSFVLDENAAISGNVSKLSKFLEEQEKVLQTLNAKFPNVDVFSDNLNMLNEIKEEPKKINDSLNNSNNELFSAMELMQYHDINRQKIERVMSVIRKLSTYLNNIFEDDNAHKEIVVAKHIAGDSTDDLVGDDDMDALIAEFGN